MQKNNTDHQQILLLQELLRTVALQGYRFITVTPVTHQRFFANSNGIAKNMRDIFGWNLLFKSNLLPPLIFELMSQADLLITLDGYCQSKIRISSLNDDLFLHSRFPTDDVRSVFFGPDTYRFARFIQQSLKVLQFEPGFSPHSPLRILDVGCGSGAGGIAAIRAIQNQHQYLLTLNDLNPVALDYATACAQVAAINATLLPGDFFNVQHMQFDLILCNPPYIHDPAARLYRDGGSLFGLELSVRIAKHALALLSPGGRLLLYTGVAMTSDEKNPLLAELIPHFSSGKFRWCYEEIDPDIFSEEIEKPGYQGVNRIAAVGLTIERMR
ncbi:methyltransferase [Cellvibrio mixtus]|uniref:methyltransferase n=1 Tax=Cellvibrio mixtus TaxID=39650 RepID=UPI0005870741|nr:methyltransferase [Cellvibrio mixtus]